MIKKSTGITKKYMYTANANNKLSNFLLSFPSILIFYIHIIKELSKILI